MNSPQFQTYIGIDYSGAKTPSSSLRGLQVFRATVDSDPQHVPPPPSARKYWTRRGVAEWLLEQLDSGVPTMVGIDHAFSFPLNYFVLHGLPFEWPTFLDDFHRHWPTDRPNMYVDFIRDGLHGNGAARTGDSRWRRLAEQRSKSAKSVFHFDVQGQVAKSTHAGLPWLRFIRDNAKKPVHFWPFDGWEIPRGSSAIAEAYPRLWSKAFHSEGRTQDEQDAFCIAAWLRRADADGSLQAYLHPPLPPQEEAIAKVEGWILGVEK